MTACVATIRVSMLHHCYPASEEGPAWLLCSVYFFAQYKVARTGNHKGRVRFLPYSPYSPPRCHYSSVCPLKSWQFVASDTWHCPHCP